MRILPILLIVITTLLFTACDNEPTPDKKSVTATVNNTPVEHEEEHEDVKYICPMHPEITSDKPGSCSICGMFLVEKEEHKDVEYVCPMHPEVTSDKPGSCSICGMFLVEKKDKPDEHQEHSHP